MKTKRRNMVKFTISKSALVATLDNSSKVVPQGSGVRAATEGIRIEVRKDKAAFRATNGDSSIQQVVSITNGTDGTVFVPSRQLRDFSALMPDGDIQIQESGANLTMSVGKVVMTLNLLRVDEAPVVSFPTGDGVAIPARTFADALGQVASAASNDASRIVLTGVLIEAREEGLRLVATDSYRLAIRDINGVSGLPAGTAIVAPQAALSAVASVVKRHENVTVRLMEKSVGFEVPGVKVVLRLIDAAYPNYNAVLPTETSTVAVIQKDALIGALRRAAHASDAMPLARLAFSPTENKVDVSAGGNSGKGAQEEMEVSITGEAITVNANPNYFETAVSAFPNGTVKISFAGALRPILLTGDGADGGLRYVVMPTRA
jgi:DNA polymerase-3 subunit beta